ncbi:MAG: glycerophosphotransferase, partial [Alphaproteobacteria bacterium]
FGSRPPGEVPELASYLGNPAIHMDLGGSAAAIDMTYLRMADVYLGDVSSQIYEFLRAPRPCVLLNPGHTDWRGDPSYGHWRFGPVVEDIHQLLPTIAAAQTGHPQFRPVQVAGFNETFEIQAEPASSRAARAIAGLLGPSPVAEPIYDAAVA